MNLSYLIFSEGTKGDTLVTYLVGLTGSASASLFLDMASGLFIESMTGTIGNFTVEPCFTALPLSKFTFYFNEISMTITIFYNVNKLII